TKSKNTNLDVSSSAIARLNSLGFNLKQTDIPSFMEFSPQGVSPALHRRTRSHRASSKTDHTALVLWQTAVLKRAEAKILATQFDPKRLTLESIRRLAILSSQQRGPVKAIESLREKGVATIVLPSLPGTFLDGAVMLNSREQPIIGLTLRHDRIDSFWFTLLHEVAHIHLHYDKLRKERSTFVDDIEIKSEDFHEKEADYLARVSLIPDSILSSIQWDEHSTLDDVTAVASRARIHKAVVAGRWQRDHQNYRKFSRLIERNTLMPMLTRRNVK
ncbi:MAG TPA: ImmA/IrrE family metallo-endopeptidase, partial [Burkholderiales bacterium]|nr:ImmA/IrrE family metallo-endopeptidase [Burkholderiales bacterium]